MNGFYGNFGAPPVNYGPPVVPYAPTKPPPYDQGFPFNFWAYMTGKVRGRTYSDADWKYLVEALAECDAADYFMEVKGISMSSHVFFRDPYFLNKMLATQNAYDAEHPITKFNVEIKSPFQEVQGKVPELEIRYIKDRNTPDVIYDTLSYHFVSGVIRNLRIGEKQPKEQTMTVYIQFFGIETYFEAFLPHIRNLKNWIDPTNVRIKGIPPGGRKLYDSVCEYIFNRWGKIFDMRFKDKPEGCDCYVRVPLPGIAEDIRPFDWRDPDVPLQFQDIDTSSPCYALWGGSGKPAGAFVEKSLKEYMPYEQERNIKAQLTHNMAIQLQQMPHPVYNPNPMVNPGMVPMGNGMPMMGNATPFPNMAGNATPFPNMAGNATPFPNMGNATPFPNAAGDATPWNSFNTYAPTPFNSFSLDNHVPTSVDPRFPPPPLPPMGGNTPPQNNMVDTAFSRRANANFKHTAGPKGRATRGRGRPGPVFADRGRGSRSNDGHDHHDSGMAVNVETDIYETSSQKSSHSNKNGSKKNGVPKAPRSQTGKVTISDKPPRIYELFPRDEEEDELAGFRKAYANTVAWNSPESVKRREELARIIQKDQDERAKHRREKYQILNDLAKEQDDAQNASRFAKAVSVNRDCKTVSDKQKILAGGYPPSRVGKFSTVVTESSEDT